MSTSQESINSFEKGLDRDSSNQNKPKNTYEYAENLINNSEGNKYCLTQENGIVSNNPDVVNLEDPLNWITIGNTYIDNIEILYQGHLDTTAEEFDNSRIAIKEIQSGKFYVAYTNHAKLNFKIDYHINNPQAKKVYNGDINLYFTDFINNPKFIRLVYSSDTTTDPYIVEQDVSNLNADFQEPIIDFVSQGQSGGQAPIGTVHFFLQYVDRYGNSSRFSNLTNGIPVININRSSGLHTQLNTVTNYAGAGSTPHLIPFGKLNATGYEGITSKTINIRIDHLDTSWAYYRIGYMYYHTNIYTPTYKLISTLITIDSDPNPHVDNITREITFTEPTEPLDDDEVTQIAKKFEYTHAKCMAQHQNHLLLGNLKNKYESIPDKIFETIATNIKIRTAIKSLSTDTTSYDSSEFNQAYDHEQSSFRYKGYKRAEVYSFGFRPIFKNGYKGKVYHIPAPERITEYNLGERFIPPTAGDNLTGTYYSTERYKIDSGYVTVSNNLFTRHHIMPDWYHNDGVSSTHRLSNDNFIGNSDKTQVNALGIYFTDIDLTLLTSDVLEDFVGFEFVRQTREISGNKRILCQGLSRAIQRPLTSSGNFPVVTDDLGVSQPLNPAVLTKDYPFALQSKAYLDISTQIEVTPNDGNFPWDINIDTGNFFRHDGLTIGAGSTYGADNKKIAPEGYVLDALESLTSPLDSFGHINKVVMPVLPPFVQVEDYTSFDEFILNIVSPETEFNLVTIPSQVKLELRDKLYFNTYDIIGIDDSAGFKGSLVPVNNALGDYTKSPNELGRRTAVGGNGLLRSLGNSTYQYNAIPVRDRTKILQASYDNNTSFLVAKPLVSQTLGFNTSYKSLYFNSLLISNALPNKQDVIDLTNNSFTLVDQYTGYTIDFKYLVKHAYCNNGFYAVPSVEAYDDILSIIKNNTNCNLRFEIRYHDDGGYTVESEVTLENPVADQETLTFPPTPWWTKIFRKDYILDKDTVKTYATCTDTEKADVDYSSTPIFDVIQELSAQYGNLYNASFFPISVVYDGIDKTTSFDIGDYSNPLFSGDTFVSWYGNNNGGYGENYSLEDFTSISGNAGLFTDNRLLHKIHTFHNNIMYFPVETSINCHFRNIGVDGVPLFPITDIEDPNTTPPNYWQRSPHFNSDDYTLAYGYNQNNINLSVAENQLTGNAGSLGRYPDRIIYSNNSVDGEVDDRFRIFSTEDFKDIPKDTGEIWNLWQFENDIYAHTENALWKTGMLERAAISTNNGDEVVLGTSSLFNQPPQKIITKQGSSGGTKSSWAYIVTPFGLVFWDTNGRKVYRLYNNQLEEISFNGMMNFFNTNGNFLTTRGSYREETHYIDDTPFNPYGHGWHFGYDDFNKRVLITKRSGILSEQKVNSMRDGNERNEFFKEFTISYSFLTNSWLSFSSYLPLKYLNSYNYVISIPDPLKVDLVANDTNFIGYHIDNENPCKFYEIGTNDSKLIYNINDYPQLEKVFDNIFIDMYNYSQIKVVGPDTFGKTLTPNRGNTIDPLTGVEIKDNLEVETSNQYSGVMDLMYNHSTVDHFKYYNDSKRNVKYILKQYRIALPKSRTINQTIDRDFPTNYNNGSLGYDTIGDRFKDKYLKVTLTWRNYERFSFVINFIKNIFRINHR